MDRLISIHAGHQARLERLLRVRTSLDRAVARKWDRLDQEAQARLQNALSGVVQEIQACRNVLRRMENDGRLQRALAAR